MGLERRLRRRCYSLLPRLILLLGRLWLWMVGWVCKACRTWRPGLRGSFVVWWRFLYLADFGLDLHETTSCRGCVAVVEFGCFGAGAPRRWRAGVSGMD